MASHTRIFNVTRQYYVNYKHAMRSFKHCACAWVEEGVSIRDLTPAEAIKARNEQAKLQEPLAYAEIPGIKFDPPVSGIAATKREGRLLYEAHQFAMGAGCA